MTVTLITLAAAAFFFVWGRIRADVVALCALLTLTLSGVITTGEALSGFANPIVIMMVGLFVVGGAIFNTGLAKMTGARLMKLGGSNETRLFLLVMGATALIGSFVSNTGTVALMLPIVVSMAAGAGISASRYLMPLAFASSLGGMMTLIGTPPNLVVAEVWEEAGHEPMTFFTFLPAGAVCLVAGTLLLIPLSKWFLSKKRPDSSDDKGKSKTMTQLVDEYGLDRDLYSLRVPSGSKICGQTIGALDLRRNYGIEVIEVRGGEEDRGFLRRISQRAATAETEITAGDTLFVRGGRSDVERFVDRLGLESASGRKSDGQLRFYEIGVAEIVLMPSSPAIHKTVADIDFRNAYGVNVLGIRRKNEYITSHIGSTEIMRSDVLLIQGTWEAIENMTKETDKWVVLGQPLEEAAKVPLDYKAPVAAAIMLMMVGALVLDIVPAVVAVMTSAILMVLTGCFRSVDAAYKTINWESVVLIAAMMPMSFALEKTGASEAVSSALVSSLGSLGPHWLLAGVYFTTSLMTLFISNTATAVLLAPIAMESAVGFGVNPLPFLFAVTFGASLCFASPFSTPPNALVMPAGQYTFMDYIKVGLPLQLILGLMMIFVLPLIFPF